MGLSKKRQLLELEDLPDLVETDAEAHRSGVLSAIKDYQKNRLKPKVERKPR